MHVETYVHWFTINTSLNCVIISITNQSNVEPIYAAYSHFMLWTCDNFLEFFFQTFKSSKYGVNSTWSQESDSTASPTCSSQLAVEAFGQRDPAQRVQGSVSHPHHVQMVLVNIDELLKIIPHSCCKHVLESVMWIQIWFNTFYLEKRTCCFLISSSTLIIFLLM